MYSTHQLTTTKSHVVSITFLISLMFSSVTLADSNLEDRLNQLQQQLDGMQKLQKEVAELKSQLAQEKQDREADKTLSANASSNTTENASNTTIGGYGEMSYQDFKDSDKNPAKADLDRFVLFFGHRFNDRLAFHSEFEIEHAVTSTSDKGEAEIEQAWLDYHFNDAANVKAGLFLIPLGFLNESHEPPTFYGVKRNSVETRIIPTTWREGGIGLFGGGVNGFNYDVGITTGFDASKIDDPAFGIRSAHQELQLANANDLSVYGSLKYTGQPGLLLGTGIFTGNTGQNGATNSALKGVDARLTLGEVHARYAANNIDLQALYAYGTLGDAAKVTAASVTTGTPIAAPKNFSGWYTQAAYHLWSKGDMDFAPFVRYERYDINQEVDIANNALASTEAKDRITTLGFSFKPDPSVVLKADYQWYQINSGKSSLNLGLGYMF